MDAEIILVGDIRYTKKAHTSFLKTKAPTEFLLALQTLMEEYGVVKIDVSIDAYGLVNHKNQ